MTLTERPAERPQPPPDDSATARLIRWSWAMVPAFLLIWLLAGSLLFYLLKGPLGLQEGEVLLMARSVAGWFAEVGSFLLVGATPLAGVAFGVAALRRGQSIALSAVVVNAALWLLTLYTFIDDIHMTYFPSWW
jgi:hypothetical protein